MNLLAQPRHVAGANVVPAQWRADLREVLITEAQLSRRVQELARAITRDYVGKDLVVVALLTGTIMFLADLLRHLALPLRLDFIGVSSYRNRTASRNLTYTKELRLEVKGRDVLLVDDIVDSGKTLAGVLPKLRQLKPRSVKSCVLLDKPARRTEALEVDYVGFVIPDLFVVGYGLDYAERYRNLPFVGVLHPELYKA
jgi:hypoxanthine phosphoribosyltransferase